MNRDNTLSPANSQIMTEVMGIDKPAFRRSAFRWSMIPAGLILTFIVIPSFQAIFGYHLIRYILPLFLVWILVVTLESPSSWNFLKKRFLELAVYADWCVIVLVYAMMAMNSGILLDLTMGDLVRISYIMIQVIICYSLGMVYENEIDKKNQHRLIRYLFLIIGINAIIALPTLFSQDLAVREYINSYQTQAGMAAQQQGFSIFAFGGLGLYTIESLFAPYFLTIIIESKGLGRLIYIGLFLVIALNIYMCSILIVQVSFLFCVVIFLLIKLFTTRTPISIRLGLLVLALLLAFLAIRTSSNSAVQYSTNRIIKYLNLRATGSIIGDTLQQRELLYSESINTFSSNPILGIGFSSFIGEPILGQRVGGHSGVLDGFAMYGLLFGVYLIFLGIKFYHLLRLSETSKGNSWVLSGILCFITYLILIILDPLVFDSSGSGIFFFTVIAGAVIASRREPTYPSVTTNK